MSMKKLRINEQTFTVVDDAAAKKTADTDLNMNDHFIHNISAGVQNNDAATVGQVKAVDLTTEKTLTAEQKAQARQNIGAAAFDMSTPFIISVDTGGNEPVIVGEFNWNELVESVISGRPVYCMCFDDEDMDEPGKPNINGATIDIYTLRNLYTEDDIAYFGEMGVSTRIITIKRDGTITQEDSSGIDGTLEKRGYAADAYVTGYRISAVSKENKSYVDNLVGDIETALDSIIVMQDELMGGGHSDCGGYQLLAQTILTEDANEIIWTQTKDSEPLSDYKDFFIYWVGKFDVTKTVNEIWICRANDGGIYFCYTGVQKRANIPMGFWWEIKEIGKLPDGTNSIYKTTYPNGMLMNFISDFAYASQGLADNNQAVKSDISTGPAIQHIRFGSLSSGAKMVAGSKAILLGRKR